MMQMQNKYWSIIFQTKVDVGDVFMILSISTS